MFKSVSCFQVLQCNVKLLLIGHNVVICCWCFNCYTLKTIFGGKGHGQHNKCWSQTIVPDPLSKRISCDMCHESCHMLHHAQYVCVTRHKFVSKPIFDIMWYSCHMTYWSSPDACVMTPKTIYCSDVLFDLHVFTLYFSSSVMGTVKLTTLIYRIWPVHNSRWWYSDTPS